MLGPYSALQVGASTISIEPVGTILTQFARFERAQYAEVREKWITEGSDLYGKTASDTYGSEHLMRLFSKFAAAHHHVGY